MSDTIVDGEQIRDTNSHMDTYDFGKHDEKALFHFVNDLDAEVTVTFHGTRQEDADTFTDGFEFATMTIGANGAGYETLSDPWEEIQVEIVATTTPTSGEINGYVMD